MPPKGIHSRPIFYGIFVYILASFSWWSVLFLRQNKRAYQEDVAVLERIWLAEQPINSTENFSASPRFLELKAELRRKNMMIAGEGLVFITLISIGFWRIHRSFSREIEVSRQQNNFLLSITHELKSPLASIKLAMETMKRHALQPEQINRIAGRSLEDVDRLEKMVENILLASRMEDPAHRFDKNWLDWSAVVRAGVEGLQRRYPNQPVKAQISPDLYLNGDALALSSVVMNLLDNAVKYTPAGTEVSVQLQQANGHLELEVADRGTGIPDAEKPKIFRRFYRIGNEETRSSKGTGLGLFIVQEIVRAHRGTIQVRNREGGGSVFQVRFPAPTQGQQAEMPLPA